MKIKRAPCFSYIFLTLTIFFLTACGGGNGGNAGNGGNNSTPEVDTLTPELLTGLQSSWQSDCSPYGAKYVIYHTTYNTDGTFSIVRLIYDDIDCTVFNTTVISTTKGTYSTSKAYLLEDGTPVLPIDYINEETLLDGTVFATSTTTYYDIVSVKDDTVTGRALYFGNSPLATSPENRPTTLDTTDKYQPENTLSLTGTWTDLSCSFDITTLLYRRYFLVFNSDGTYSGQYNYYSTSSCTFGSGSPTVIVSGTYTTGQRITTDRAGIAWELNLTPDNSLTTYTIVERHNNLTTGQTLYFGDGIPPTTESARTTSINYIDAYHRM